MKTKTRLTKLLVLVFIFFMNTGTALACDVCAENQPAGLENVTHGEGPTAVWDYVISWGAVIIVGFTLIYSLKYLIKPKENSKSHIKNIVIDNL
ncbi:hypothetical protein [Marivirga harenae]|uniref:hypothetical protein n=1 Tax=Marivirga harenae TaxID=2010992 RepID=UPI0026DF2A8D|nr:hypothetical protein [Marivirga harenae]WKV12964.1 hypothetical protein Q3Y49_03870 [Marivirga harenae]|tara:strand:- start:80854 stop:81135 length:282 start_codon:yes stop_codon:yes gene_type:complete